MKNEKNPLFSLPKKKIKKIHYLKFRVAGELVGFT